jgi:hypothetical protein
LTVRPCGRFLGKARRSRPRRRYAGHDERGDRTLQDIEDLILARVGVTRRLVPRCVPVT